MNCKFENINVFFLSNPHAIISLAFSTDNAFASSNFKSFHKNFSSSVNCIIRGTLKTSCNHLKTIKY